jgi:iron complex outermembrane receptor protein
MKRIIGTLVLLVICSALFGQERLSVTVTDSATGEPVIGASVVVKGTTVGSATAVDGQAQISGPVGKHELVISFLGYAPKTIPVDFSIEASLHIQLKEEAVSHEVIVQATRANKVITASPTRVEVLTEEIEEAATMEPARIAHLITHSTGVQVQQNSASSGYADVRIQGLDGKYAMFLKDGFPIYGGFGGQLGIMHIPPLDLRQVEYIKGPASTLYGGGAISGLINLISKQPDPDGSLSIMMNGSHLGASNINTFYSKRSGNKGLTLYAGYDRHEPFDADGDGFSDIPSQLKFNFNPKAFIYFSKRTELMVGLEVTHESRTGGDMEILAEETRDSTNFFREANRSERIALQAMFRHRNKKQGEWVIKQGLYSFERDLRIHPAFNAPDQYFSGTQYQSFSELTFRTWSDEHSLVLGANGYGDYFSENRSQEFVLRNYDSWTAGGFIQHTWDLSNKFSTEEGVRVDHAFEQGTFVLPRLSGIMKWSSKFTSRFSGALGYRMPTIFDPAAEIIGYQGVLPINDQEAERSYGFNADLNFKVPVGEEGFFRINQMFFYNRIDDPLWLVDTGTASSGILAYSNQDGYLESIGFETSMKINVGIVTWFLGYTFTDPEFISNVTGNGDGIPLNSRHNIKGDILFDLPKWQLAVDYEYNSSLYTSLGEEKRSLLVFGFIMRHWIGDHWQIFANLENFTDVRQTRYESLVDPIFNTPQFTEVWAPLDGFYANAGFRITL